MMQLMVGELVKCSGLIVCILYYYDVIGLFSLFLCFGVGYWFYGQVDIECLYCIQVLCQLGLLLVDIGFVLFGLQLLLVELVDCQIVQFDCDLVDVVCLCEWLMYLCS